MHMVRHQMTFQNFYTFIFAKQLNNFTQALSLLIVNDFSSILRRENNVIFTYPFCMWKTICLISHKNTPSMKQYNLNTYIILEGAFLRLTLWLHPHSGWFFVSRALARSTGSRPYKKTEHIAVPGLSFYFLGALYNELDSAFLSGVNALVKNATPPNTNDVK